MTTLILIIFLVNPDGGGAHSSIWTQQFKTSEACAYAAVELMKINGHGLATGIGFRGKHAVEAICIPN